MFHHVTAPKALGDNDELVAIQRRVGFEAEFGSGREVAVAIRKCVIEAYTNLHAIVGEEAADAAFDALVASRVDAPQQTWREALYATDADICMTMMVGRAFRELAAYARYGISLNGGVAESDRVNLLNAAYQRGLELELLTRWSFKGSELENILLQADARLDLDHGKPIDPRSLAALADVDEQALRNLIAEDELMIVCGRVPASDAHAWLVTETDNFRPSIWRAQEPFRDLPGWQAIAA